MTIRAVAKEMGISVGKAHQLKMKVAAFNVHLNMNIDPEEVRGILKETPLEEDARQGEETAAGVPHSVSPTLTSCEVGRHEGLPSSPQSPLQTRMEHNPTTLSPLKEAQPSGEPDLTIPAFLDRRVRA